MVSLDEFFDICAYIPFSQSCLHGPRLFTIIKKMGGNKEEQEQYKNKL